MAKPTIRTCAVCDMENEQPGSICRPCSDALHQLTNQDGTWARPHGRRSSPGP